MKKQLKRIIAKSIAEVIAILWLREAAGILIALYGKGK